MAETTKAEVLFEFQQVAGQLRRAATVSDARHPASYPWGPREILAHITFWAVQATQHFASRLPTLSYGAGSDWGTEVVRTFDAAFEALADPRPGKEDAQSQGWRMVACKGITLPLSVQETDDLHERVDDAFNGAAAELARHLSFAEVLERTKQAHAELYRLLADWPAGDFELGNPIYERLLRIVAHHRQHVDELERFDYSS